jgi:hypothetical protein
MLLDDHPLTRALHDDWREQIGSTFPNVNVTASSDCLSLITYISTAPEKFYSIPAFRKYLDFLAEAFSKNQNALAESMKEHIASLSLADKILTEVNRLPIHDIHTPYDHQELISFIDKQIHYNLLKVYETPYLQLIQLLAKFILQKKKKGTENLDLRNCVEVLDSEGYKDLTRIYFPGIRNGIAHGKVLFSDTKITYVDKKGNRESKNTRQIIEIFDQSLDVVNACCLAYKVFCFSNPDFIKKYKISLPQSFLISELQAKCNSPGWKITNCLESEAMQDKSQLMIYVENRFWDFRKVQWSAFMTAYWAEKLTQNYDRFFFSLRSKNAALSPVGWAAFNGNLLRSLRERGEEIEKYGPSLENNLIYFIPKFKFPRIVYKWGSLLISWRTILPLFWAKSIEKSFPKKFNLRDTRIHSKGFFSVVEDASVVIPKEYQVDIQNFIRTNRKKIVKSVIKKSKRTFPLFSYKRLLPVRKLRIFLYNKDMRVRSLRNSGLPQEVVATIEINSSKRIQTIDIIGGTPEQIGKYRIVWNKSWLQTQINEDLMERVNSPL